MPNADFQERLQRIAANSRHQVAGRSTAPAVGLRRLNYRLLLAGVLLMSIGVQSIKFANKSQESLLQSSVPFGAGGLGLAGIAILLVGLVVLKRAIPAPRATSAARAPSSGHARPLRQPPQRAILASSLIGGALGSMACFVMFLQDAAHLVDTERAQIVANGGTLIALALAGLSLILGFVGVFRRGSALWRVPLAFLVSGALTYGGFRVNDVNLLEWPGLMAYLQ
jgi:hypothetical protein